MSQTSKKRSVKATVRESAWGEFIKETSELTGLCRYVAKKRTIDRIKDAFVGHIEGFIVAAGPTGKNKLRVIVRFSPGQSRSTLETALNDRLSAEFPKTRLKLDVRATYLSKDKTKAQPDTISVTWAFSKTAKRPEAEEFARLMTVVVDTLKPIVRPRDGRCELCAGSQVAKLTLRNGVPGYYCADCEKKESARVHIHVRKVADEGRVVKYWQACIIGLIAAIFAAAAAGFVASLVTPRLSAGMDTVDEWTCFPVIAVMVTGPLIAPVYTAFTKAAGRDDASVAGLGLWLIMIEIVFANAAYFVFCAYGSGTPLGLDLAAAALGRFLKEPFFHILILLVMLFTGVFAAAQGIEQIRRTKITYESLDDIV